MGGASCGPLSASLRWNWRGRCGANVCLNASGRVGQSGLVTDGGQVAEALREVTAGGAHVSIDALGSAETCVASIESLRRRGRHVQVGLLPAALGRPELPMDRVIAYERHCDHSCTAKGSLLGATPAGQAVYA